MVFVNPRRRRLRYASVVLLVLGVMTALAGCWLIFTVQLAYMTSHGSAWQEPTAGRLKEQTQLGIYLTISAAVLYLASIGAVLRAEPRGCRDVWWVFVALLGLCGVLVNIVISG